MASSSSQSPPHAPGKEPMIEPEEGNKSGSEREYEGMPPPPRRQRMERSGPSITRDPYLPSSYEPYPREVSYVLRNYSNVDAWDWYPYKVHKWVYQERVPPQYLLPPTGYSVERELAAAIAHFDRENQYAEQACKDAKLFVEKMKEQKDEILTMRRQVDQLHRSIFAITDELNRVSDLTHNVDDRLENVEILVHPIGHAQHPVAVPEEEEEEDPEEEDPMEHLDEEPAIMNHNDY